MLTPYVMKKNEKHIIAERNKPKRLNPRILKFINAYLEHGNAAQAVREAGYKTSVPHMRGYKLLHSKRIREAMDKLTLERVSKGYLVRKLNSISDEQSADYHAKIKAIQTINNMQGYNAPVKTENVHISATLDDLRTISVQYTQEE